MTKIPVRKKCEMCNGIGTIYEDIYLVTPQVSHNVPTPQLCNKCDGTGWLPTDLFIEINNIPELKEWWK